jgi:magnesium chelatase family protein
MERSLHQTVHMKVYSLLQHDPMPRSVEVELHSRFQIPSFQILGLPGPEIQEARERIIAAFAASGFEFPKKRVIANLTPSAERKTGTGHDLSIAIKILSTILDLAWPDQIYAWGELGLDGSVKPTQHTAQWLEFFCRLHASSDQPIIFVCSSADAWAYHSLIQWRKQHHLAVPEAVQIHILDHLGQLGLGLSFENTNQFHLKFLNRFESPALPTAHSNLLPLHPQLEQVLSLALIGEHHLLLLGPKGVGKSQTLEWLAALAPPPNPLQTWNRILNHATVDSEFANRIQLETTDFYHSLNQRPIRRIHANLRPTHLLGSWSKSGFQAGELARAHGGYLIADEFPEWPRDAKECLREPLEQREFRLTRKQGTIQMQCDLQFIGTGNLCRCGGIPAVVMAKLGASMGDHKKKNASHHRSQCKCSPLDARDYLAKISGPLMDRIDLIAIHALQPAQKTTTDPDRLKYKIFDARLFCIDTWGCYPGKLPVPYLEKKLENSAFRLLLQGTPSLRSKHKVMRIAHSIQALEGSSELTEAHVFQALTYRMENLSE